MDDFSPTPNNPLKRKDGKVMSYDDSGTGGIAKFSFGCKVCGKLVKGKMQFGDAAERTRWSRSVKGSARHADCYGKLDAYPQAFYHGGVLYNGADGVKATQTQGDDTVKNTQPEQINTSDKPVQHNSDGLAETIADAIFPKVEGRINQKLDEKVESVEAILDQKVKEALDAHIRKIIIETPEGKEYTVDGLTHMQFYEVFAIVLASLDEPPEHRTNVYLYGGAGGGKTSIAKQIAETIEKLLKEKDPEAAFPFRHISLNMQSQPSLLIGYRDANGQYVETDYFRWFTQGGLFLFDEWDNTKGNLQTSMNTGLANGEMAFPCGIVKRHKNAIAIAAGNTPMLGANSTYASRVQADGATRERFVFIEFHYDEKLERQVSLMNNPKSEKWINWVQSVRKAVVELKLNLVVSPRASIFGSKLLKLGKFSPDKVADMVLFKGIDKDTKVKIVNKCPLPVIS